MTKQKEMEILAKAISDLGELSYLGPWLREISGELERDIRSDLYPTITLAHARAQAARIIAQGQAEALSIRNKAHKELAQAREDALAYRTRAARDIAAGAERLAAMARQLGVAQ